MSGSNDGVVSGATFNSTGGQLGGSYEFDGIDDTIQDNDFSGVYNVSNATFGMGAWINSKGNSSATSGNPSMLYLSYNGNNPLGVINTPSNGTFVSCEVQSITGGGATTSFPINRNTDYFVFCNFLSNGTVITNIELYINGTLLENKSINGRNGVHGGGLTDRLHIGSQKPSFKRYFNGSVDEVRFYNRTLSASEISTLYERQSNVYFDAKLQEAWQAVDWNRNYLEHNDVYLWADYSCSSQSNWELFNPYYYFRQCVDGGLCSESLT